MPDFNGFATNVQLGRLLNVSNTWEILYNQSVHGQIDDIISLVAVGLPYHGYGNTNQVNIPRAQYYNRSWIYRGGKNQANPTPQTTGYGLIGFWLNGVAMYTPATDTRPPFGYATPVGFHFNSTYAEGNALNQIIDSNHWYKNDLAGGRATTDGLYFYNDISFLNIWSTGLGGTPLSSTVHGLPETSIIPYLADGFLHPDGHSKILGFSTDGYPVYGPYGYTNPIDSNSGISRMQSGYVLKNISYRVGTTASDTNTYPMGIFVEDFTFNNSGTLDTHNGRYCVTPDYPQGTYAYFCTIDAQGKPVYPYIIGNTFYGVVDTVTAEPAPQYASAYPNWVTPAGNLGKIQALEFFELGLQAIDPTGNPDGQDVNYTLVSGKLPAGLQIDSSGQVTGNPKDTYSIDGVPEAVDKDRTSQFTIRAISSSGKITDRNFSITVTGNYPPQILTSNYLPLGEFFDGTEISIQLSAVDLNNDTISFTLLSGELPLGVSLSNSGLISGVIIPNISGNQNQLTGWGKSQWDLDNWEFTTRSTNYIYNFTVQASDGKSLDTRNYRIEVFSHNDVRADNSVITDDITVFSADSTADRMPILLTKSLGEYSTYRSGNFFAFKFEAIDYDNVPVTYALTSIGGTGWDDVNWDQDGTSWDQGTFSLPPGLELNPTTGWLTGYIPPQTSAIQNYTFGLYAYNTFDPTLKSDYRTFSINILGALDLTVNWITGSDLGYIDAGKVSQLYVEANAPSGKKLYYTLQSGSKLPQGLTLLNDGTISGRCSFQAFDLDQGTTTFDVTNSLNGVLAAPTTFDRTYTFTVIAGDSSLSYTDPVSGLVKNQNLVSGLKTFTLQVNSVTYGPYDNLYIACRPELPKRSLLNTILGNTDYFAIDDIYRPNDPWWGIQTDIKALVGYGLNPSQLSDYISAMQNRHYNKRFYFGDYNWAQAKDKNGNVLYEVIYVDLIEDTKTYTRINGQVIKNIPAPSFITMSGETVYPNDLDLMYNDIVVHVGTSDTNVLPQWQTSIQPNGKILGFQTAAVLAYLKPGTAEKVLYKLKQNVPNDIKLVPFVVDRYILDNNLDTNFDLATGKWIEKFYTTFDTGYTLSITPSATVDFAIDIPFDHVDQQTVSTINSYGGLDGVTGDYNNKYVIFSTQQNYNQTTFPNLQNDGWNQNGSVIPGWTELNNGSSTINKRAGVWLITVSNGQLNLSFVQEISINQVVKVRFGYKANKTLQYNSANVGIAGQTVPKYEVVNVETTQLKIPTTFDNSKTRFINNEDQYTTPFTNDKYLKFPKIGVFS